VAFQQLKEKLTTAPVLKAYRTERTTIIETDASDFAMGAALVQIDEDTKQELPITYYSRKLKAVEVNYPANEREMLAILDALKEWRRYPLPVVAESFARWGLDFIGRLPKTKQGNRWIIVAIDHATNWAVARALQKATTQAVSRVPLP
jgi:hypothetical protein